MAYEVNGKNVSGLRYVYLMLVGLGALCMLVVRQPARLLGLKKFVTSAFVDGNRVWLTDPEHRHRLEYPVVESTAGSLREDDVKSLVRELVEDRDWISLSELIADWDEARAACPEQWRLIHIATDAALLTLADTDSLAQICAPQAEARISDDALTEMIALCQSNADLYPLAALVTLARVQQAWDLRGGDYADNVPEQAWDWIGTHLSKAADLLQAAGIDTRNSPLLFNARLSLLPFHDEAGRHILAWYEDAVKSDPGDSAPHNVIGNFLLPRWFGDYEILETTARQGASWSSAEMGMGAYAIVYGAAIDAENIPIAFMDIDLYKTAVTDLVLYRGANPRHIPRLSQFLHRQSQWGYISGMDDEDKAHWDSQLHEIYLLGLKIVEDHLSAVHPDSWQRGEEDALNMVSLAMGQELEDGANLVMGPNGIKAIFPDDLGDGPDGPRLQH